MDPSFVLPSELWVTFGDGHFFSFAITVGELLKSKIWETNYPKLLELLLGIIKTPVDPSTVMKAIELSIHL